MRKRLTSIFLDVQFNMELGNDKQLPFLGVMVTRTTNGDLTTTVYQKATTIIRMLHFSSTHRTGPSVISKRNKKNFDVTTTSEVVTYDTFPQPVSPSKALCYLCWCELLACAISLLQVWRVSCIAPETKLHHP